MADLLPPSSAQWTELLATEAAVAPVTCRLYLIATTPREYGIEDGVRAVGGAAFVAAGDEFVIDDAPSDAAAVSLIRIGDNVWLST